MIHLHIISPFNKLKNFAHQISTGNLDAPLLMDKNNIFGVFTESFDIMRFQQVANNIIANSYKYADTPINIDFILKQYNLKIIRLLIHYLKYSYYLN